MIGDIGSSPARVRRAAAGKAKYFESDIDDDDFEERVSGPLNVPYGSDWAGVPHGGDDGAGPSDAAARARARARTKTPTRTTGKRRAPRGRKKVPAPDMDDELEKEEIRPGDESGKVTEEEAEKEQEEEYEPAEEEDNGDNDEDDDEDEGVPEESDEDGVDNKRGKRPTAANSKRKVTVKGSTKVTTAASRTQPVNSRKGPATLSTTNGKGKQVAGMTSAASVSKTSVGGIARRAPLRSPSPVKLGSAVSPGGPIRRVGLSKRARLKPISPVKLPPPS